MRNHSSNTSGCRPGVLSSSFYSHSSHRFVLYAQEPGRLGLMTVPISQLRKPRLSCLAAIQEQAGQSTDVVLGLRTPSCVLSTSSRFSPKGDEQVTSTNMELWLHYCPQNYPVHQLKGQTHDPNGSPVVIQQTLTMYLLCARHW